MCVQVSSVAAVALPVYAIIIIVVVAVLLGAVCVVALLVGAVHYRNTKFRTRQ